MGRHASFPSVEAMLEPPVLAGLLDRPVRSVALEAMETACFSSTESVFEAVRVDGESVPAAVVKRLCWSENWHAIATEDTCGREIAIWESGVLDRMPPEMGHPIRATARFEGGAALLMDDVGRHFVPEDDDATLEQATGILRSMAAMHATFWEQPPVAELGPATCSLERLVSALSPSSLRGLDSVLPDAVIVVELPEGWSLLPEVVDPGLARDLRSLAEDPGPLVAALEAYPTTLLHGDLRLGNVAWDGTRAIGVDWHPTVAPAGWDLAYFVHSLWVGSPVHPDEAMAAYRDMLVERLDHGRSWSWWDDHLDVCIAAVVAMLASVNGLHRPAEHDPDLHPPWTSIQWWVERAVPGLRRLDAS